MSNKRKISQLSGSMIRRGKKPAKVGFVLSSPGDSEDPGSSRVAERGVPKARTQEKLSPVPPLRAITREFEAESHAPSADDVVLPDFDRARISQTSRCIGALDRR